jgi:hypothetical protein
MRYMIFLILLFIIEVNTAQQCDTNIKPSNNPLTAYQWRGNRCEGTYFVQVDAPRLEIIGFTKGSLRYDLDSDEVIYVVNPTDGVIHVRSRSIPQNSCYQMDAELFPHGALKWSVHDVLLNLNYTSAQIAVLGFIDRNIDGNLERLYIPVQPSSKMSNRNAHEVTKLILRTSFDEIVDLKYSYCTYNNGQMGKIIDSVSLDDAFNAYQAIEISLPDLSKGEYCFVIEGFNSEDFTDRVRAKFIILLL